MVPCHLLTVPNFQPELDLWSHIFASTSEALVPRIPFHQQVNCQDRSKSSNQVSPAHSVLPLKITPSPTGGLFLLRPFGFFFSDRWRRLGSRVRTGQGFFSALKEEVVRGKKLSPSRSRAKSPARSGSPLSSSLRRKKSSSSNNFGPNLEALIARSGSLRPLGETLTPLMEGPHPDGGEVGESKRVGSGLGQRMRGHLSRGPSVTSNGYSNGSSHGSNKRSDLRLLLGVMGAPLAPMHVSTTDPLPHLNIKDTPIG